MNKFLCATIFDCKILAFDIKCQLAFNINNDKVPSAFLTCTYLACISAFSSLPTRESAVRLEFESSHGNCLSMHGVVPDWRASPSYDGHPRVGLSKLQNVCFDSEAAPWATVVLRPPYMPP